jgi:hypothetical protein
MRSPVRFATAWVKCLVLCADNQSGLLAIAERSTGTSALYRGDWQPRWSRHILQKNQLSLWSKVFAGFYRRALRSILTRLHLGELDSSEVLWPGL